LKESGQLISYGAKEVKIKKKYPFWRTAPSLGMRLVTSLVDQMDGTIELDRSSRTVFTIVVKKKE